MSEEKRARLAETVKDYYAGEEVVDLYRRGTINVGLWASEEAVLTEYFRKDDRLVELGSGCGRIAFGLHEIGYRHLIGVEPSREMVKEARKLGKSLEYGVPFRVGDARELEFEDNLFDGAVFGFNGLMQIPGRDQRRAALKEILRVVRPGGYFVFTTHDRENYRYKKYWQDERKRWSREKQERALVEFGDRLENTDIGPLYIHVPTPPEMRGELKATGWICLWDKLRSQLAVERPVVQQFSDECRFWLARKPESTEG